MASNNAKVPASTSEGTPQIRKNSQAAGGQSDRRPKRFTVVSDTRNGRRLIACLYQRPRHAHILRSEEQVDDKKPPQMTFDLFIDSLMKSIRKCRFLGEEQPFFHRSAMEAFFQDERPYLFEKTPTTNLAIYLNAYAVGYSRLQALLITLLVAGEARRRESGWPYRLTWALRDYIPSARLRSELDALNNESARLVPYHIAAYRALTWRDWLPFLERVESFWGTPGNSSPLLALRRRIYERSQGTFAELLTHSFRREGNVDDRQMQAVTFNPHARVSSRDATRHQADPSRFIDAAQQLRCEFRLARRWQRPFEDLLALGLESFIWNTVFSTARLFMSDFVMLDSSDPFLVDVGADQPLFARSLFTATSYADHLSRARCLLTGNAEPSSHGKTAGRKITVYHLLRDLRMLRLWNDVTRRSVPQSEGVKSGRRTVDAESLVADAINRELEEAIMQGLLQPDYYHPSYNNPSFDPGIDKAEAKSPDYLHLNAHAVSRRLQWLDETMFDGTFLSGPLSGYSSSLWPSESDVRKFRDSQPSKGRVRKASSRRRR